jgi:hypothetical protein
VAVLEVWDCRRCDATGYAVGSDFFFQLMFCAATASIVSGALAERIKLWPFLIFTVGPDRDHLPDPGVVAVGRRLPVAMGFSDFAGSTLVHSVGGWAALAGRIILGPRLGKYGKDGRKVNPMPGSNLALATLGTFILWLGWFGFNGARSWRWARPMRRGRRQPDLRQHQHGGCRRCGCSADPDADALQEGRPDHGAERRAGRSGVDHRRPLTRPCSATLIGAWVA